MVMFLMNFFYLMIFLFSMMVFISNRKHLLITLISLEFIVLIIYLYMYMCFSMMVLENYFSMVFLTFSVCEGSLGLSILVCLIRTHGNDYFQTYNILQC